MARESKPSSSITSQKEEKIISAGIKETKASLDNGVLTITSPMRDFTKFLDLQNAYHREFIKAFWTHVTDEKFNWETLFNSAEERARCSETFVAKVGPQYWGTEENRRKYLFAESNGKYSKQFRYPEMSAELTRVFDILLQKKAKAEFGQFKREKSVCQESLISSTPAQEQPSEITTSPTPWRSRRRSPAAKAKQPSDNQSSTKKRDSLQPVQSQSDASTLTSLDESNSEKNDEDVFRKPARPRRLSAISNSQLTTKQLHQDLQDSLMGAFTPLTDLAASDADDKENNPSSKKAENTKNMRKKRRDTGKQGASGSWHRFRRLERSCAQRTKFLVTASTQGNMAPVHAAYKKFDSVADFLTSMEYEADVHRWHKGTPENPDDRGARLFAASVKFGWSDFEARIRPGIEADYSLVVEELQRAWEACDEGSLVLVAGGGAGLSDNDAATFDILVTLHITLL